MEAWTSRSDPGKQLALSVAAAVVGVVLAIGFRGFRTGGENALAGFLLGVMLLVIGVAGVLVSGRQTVTVDPRTKLIHVEDSYPVGAKSRVIPFGEVESVGIGYLGKKSNFVEWYYLVLHLRTGEEYPLFAPGRFYEGGSDRSTVEGWRQRLESYLGLRGPTALAP
jgi:hypothetical protein